MICCIALRIFASYVSYVTYVSYVSYALGSHRIAVSVRWVGCIVGVGCVGVTGGGCGELYVSYVSYVPRNHVCPMSPSRYIWRRVNQDPPALLQDSACLDLRFRHGEFATARVAPPFFDSSSLTMFDR